MTRQVSAPKKRDVVVIKRVKESKKDVGVEGRGRAREGYANRMMTITAARIPGGGVVSKKGF